MNQRIEKARNIFQLWEDGDGDMGELATGLYDLTADYEALLKDYEALEAKAWWHRMSNEDIAAELSATFDLNLYTTRGIANWILEVK